MGDIVKKFKIKSVKKCIASCYFDSGSLYSFIRETLARKLGGLMRLPKPRVFSGLGDGKFKANFMIEIEIQIKGVWCPCSLYVIKDSLIEDDILLGHGFFQAFNIRLDPRKRDIIVTKDELLYSKKIRKSKI